MGVMQTLDKRTGDTPVHWDENSPDEIEQAQATFDSLRSKGYRAFRMNKDGKKGEQINKFDPALGRILMVPALVGG